jgi:hypothetical protein
MAEALKVNTTLTTLGLRNNQIGNDGAKLIAEALKINKTLTTLNLGGNNIDKDGAELIADALKENKTLTTLNLYHNNIGKDGAKVIADALKVNKTLNTLNLGWNKIDDDGAKLIAKALETNKTLTTLNLGWNNIDKDGVELIADALEVNRGIVKKVATLLVKNFDQEKNDEIKIPLKYLKIYQVCDKDLLKKYIGNDKKFDIYIKKVDYYIGENFLEFTEVSKSPFIPKELLHLVSSYLPKSLWDIKLGKSFYNLKVKVDSYLDKLKQTNLKELQEIKTIFSEKSKDKSDIITVKKLLALHDKNLDKIVGDYCESMEIKVANISGENNQFEDLNEV